MKKLVTIIISCVFIMSFLTIVSASPAIPASDMWTVPDGQTSIVASDVVGGTELEFTHAHYAHTINSTEAYKLDGLYLHITNISIADQTLDLFLSKNSKENSESVNAGGIQLLIAKAGGSIMIFRGTTIPPNSNNMPNYLDGAVADRQGVWLYSYRNTDGSFTININGSINVVDQATVEAVYGSADPSVYVTMGAGWYTGDTSGNLLIRELSSGNTNRLLSYYDPYGRDAMVLGNGDMSNIEISHYGNHGASEITAKKIVMDKLVIDDIRPESDFAICFGSTNDGVALSTSNAFYVQINNDGGVWIQKRGIDSAAISGGTFTRNDVREFPLSFSVSVYKSERSGAYKFTIVGSYDDNSTSTVIFNIGEAEMTTMFGTDTELQSYIGFASWNTQNITIVDITHRDAPIPTVTPTVTPTVAPIDATVTVTPTVTPTVAPIDATVTVTAPTIAVPVQTGDSAVIFPMILFLIISSGILIKIKKERTQNQ